MSGKITFFCALGLLVASTALALAQPATNRPPAAGSGTRSGAPPATGTPPVTTNQGSQGAPPAADAAATPPPWSSTCSSETRTAAPDCSVEQRAITTNTGQLVALVRVRVPADTKKPVMMIQVPFGLFLPAGLAIDIDGANPQKAELQTCDGGGCYAGLPISSDMLTAMFNGQKLNVSFQNLSKQPIKVPMALTGFRAVFMKIN